MQLHSPYLAGSSALLTMPGCCAGAAGKPVSVLFAGKSAEALQDPAVAQLSRWGYPVPSCVEALQRLKGSPDAAHQDLFARLSGQSCFQQQNLKHVIQSLLYIKPHSLLIPDNCHALLPYADFNRKAAKEYCEVMALL